MTAFAAVLLPTCFVSRYLQSSYPGFCFCLKSCHHIFSFFVSLFDNEAHRYGIFPVLCSLDYSLVGQPTTDNDLLLPGST